jgi:hypothetical protein
MVMPTEQRGSILVGVLGTTTLLSMAAGGLLLVAANSRNEEDLAFRRTGCYYDAESGLMMAASWLKAHDSSFIASKHDAWGAGKDTSFHSLLLDNGATVSITIRDNTAYDPNDKTKTIIAKAVNGSETVQFSWDIGAADNKFQGGKPTPTLTLQNWRSL